MSNTFLGPAATDETRSWRLFPRGLCYAFCTQRQTVRRHVSRDDFYCSSCDIMDVISRYLYEESNENPSDKIRTENLQNTALRALPLS
jgi:hypothetical protein